jgi:hypothetical protein
MRLKFEGIHLVDFRIDILDGTALSNQFENCGKNTTSIENKIAHAGFRACKEQYPYATASHRTSTDAKRGDETARSRCDRDELQIPFPPHFHLLQERAECTPPHLSVSGIVSGFVGETNAMLRTKACKLCFHGLQRILKIEIGTEQ